MFVLHLNRFVHASAKEKINLKKTKTDFLWLVWVKHFGIRLPT